MIYLTSRLVYVRCANMRFYLFRSSEQPGHNAWSGSVRTVWQGARGKVLAYALVVWSVIYVVLSKVRTVFRNIIKINSLNYSGVYRGGHQVLVRAKFAVAGDGDITMNLAVRSVCWGNLEICLYHLAGVHKHEYKCMVDSSTQTMKQTLFAVVDRILSYLGHLIFYSNTLIVYYFRSSSEEAIALINDAFG